MSEDPVIPPERRVSLQSVFQKWSDPDHGEDISIPYDWKASVLPKLKEGDIKGMRQAALPAMQFKLIELAMEGKSTEMIQYMAASKVLGQEGHGEIQRVESTISYEKMPPEQLISVIQSSLSKITKLNPAFKVEAILSPPKLGFDDPADPEAVQAEFQVVASDDDQDSGS